MQLSCAVALVGVSRRQLYHYVVHAPCNEGLLQETQEYECHSATFMYSFG